MKIRVAKVDLDGAIQAANIGVGGKEDGNLASHFLFRYLDDKVEVLASNGFRIMASSLLTPAEVSEATDGDAFTVVAWRLLKWVSAVGDEVLTLDYSNGVVKATSGRGSLRFASLNPKDFPFWDNQLTEANSVCKVNAKKLAVTLDYSRQFITKSEQKAAGLISVDCQKGTFYSSDSTAVTLVTIPGMEESSLRIHGHDVPAVISFLNLKGVEEVEVLEHDRCVFFRGNGGVVGVTRWTHAFPNLKIKKDDEPRCWFTVAGAEIESALNLLSASEIKGNAVVHFRFDNGGVVLSVDSASGGQEKDEQRIACLAHEGMDALATDGYQGFILAQEYLDPIVKNHGDKPVKFGVSWMKGKNGYVRFRNEVDGLDFLTLVVWSKLVWSKL